METYRNLPIDEASRYAIKTVAYLDGAIDELDHKIENGTGWFSESSIVTFKKDRWKYKEKRKELKDSFPEYFL